jgi:glycosyltransferase involved in cell wall biosynthesis
MARVLLIEPFYGGSHRAFADGLQAHSRHEIVLLTLPAGEWRQRMRRGAQELAKLSDELPGAFDGIVATDMVDLAVFLTLTRPRFTSTPVMAYFHENQFTYPRLRGTKLNSWFGQINYLSALAADVVAFNSEFHLGDFVGALRALSRQPNNWLTPEAIDEIAARSVVLPVGVELRWLDSHRLDRAPGLPPLILWNHRWEFDKGPEVFARAITTLAEQGAHFRLALAGDPGINPHPALVELRDRLADRVSESGFVADRAAYARLLWESDIVVSTARHEFFGVGMVEALYCGCFPVVAARYNYPALVPKALHAVCLFESEVALVELLRGALADRRERPELRASAERFAWERVIGAWDEALERLAGGPGRGSAGGSDR